MKLSKIISFLIIIGILLPSFSFSQEINQPPKVPGTLQEAGRIGLNVLKAFPQALKEPWQEALRIWGRMADIFSNWWNYYIFPWLKSIWHKILSIFIQETERRKPIIKEEFEKEKKEIKEEIKTETSKAGKSLWERFKELIK